MDFGNHWNGSGDRRRLSESGICAEENPGYIRRRLYNGLPIRTFVTPSEDGDRSSVTFHSLHNFKGDAGQTGKCGVSLEQFDDFPSPTINIAWEYLSCPICSDPCIEPTIINCGHKFCKDCIEKWRKEKPICPICSSLITSLHRLYSDDLLLESQLDSLPAEVRNRFKKAQTTRLEKLLEERKSRNVMTRVRQKLDNSLTFIRCKNVASLKDKLSSTGLRLRRKLYMWISQWNVGFIVGIILVGLFVLLASNMRAFSNFMQYLWLAIRKYDGVIPNNWLKDSDSVLLKNAPTVEPKQAPSAFESIVEDLNIFGRRF